MAGPTRRLAPFGAAALAAALLAAQALAAPIARAAGPAVSFTDPAPGETILADSVFRLGWTESARASAPIVHRTLATYRGASPDGTDCWGAHTALLSRQSTDGPGGTLVTALETDTCTYWVVEVVDVEGRSSKARSGYVRGGSAGELRLTVVFPARGAATDVPPLPDLTIRWREGGAAAVSQRTVVEQTAPMTGDRTCVGAAWRLARVLDAAAPALQVEGLEDGRCYRYIIGVADEAGRGATVVSGPLLVTRSPPPCAYGAVEIDAAALEDWAHAALDTTHSLPRGYVPPDLVSTSGIPRVNSDLRIRAIAYDDLAALAAAARRAGAPIDLTSAYRSHRLQARTYAGYEGSIGAVEGLLRAARPGHSEHQLGLAIDVKAYRGPSPASIADWGQTQAGAWLRSHAWRYGWVMSYPKEASPAATCYRYEPWHYRYVGREVARAVHESGLALREYLWLAGSLGSP